MSQGAIFTFHRVTYIGYGKYPSLRKTCHLRENGGASGRELGDAGSREKSNEEIAKSKTLSFGPLVKGFCVEGWARARILFSVAI